MSGNVVFVQTQIGKKQGGLVVHACAAQGEPVQGRLPVLGEGVVARHRDPKGRSTRPPQGHNIQVVAEGETFYNPANALKAAQTMLQAQPDLNVIVGADQGATGAQQALTGQKVTLIGYGGGGVGLKARRRRPVVRHGRAAAGDRGQARDAVRDQGGEDRQGLRRDRRPRRACRTEAS